MENNEYLEIIFNDLDDDYISQSEEKYYEDIIYDANGAKIFLSRAHLNYIFETDKYRIYLNLSSNYLDIYKRLGPLNDIKNISGPILIIRDNNISFFERTTKSVDKKIYSSDDLIDGEVERLLKLKVFL
jgi:hypothetical protein